MLIIIYGHVNIESFLPKPNTNHAEHVLFTKTGCMKTIYITQHFFNHLIIQNDTL